MIAKNLRIGNFIEHSYFIDKPNMVIELRNRVLKTDNKEFELINYEQVKPIILDETWLLKMNFVKIYESNFREKWEYDKDYRFGFNKNKSLKNTPEGICFKGETYNHIKYVHQLQNLFFALTGNEIQVKQEVSV